MRTVLIVVLICLSLPAFCQNGKPAPVPPTAAEQTGAGQYNVNVGVNPDTIQAATKSVETMAQLIGKYVSGPMSIYYASSVRRQFALGWTEIGMCVGSAVLLLFCLVYLKDFDFSGDFQIIPTAVTIFAFIFAIVFVVTLTYMPAAIGRISAPESFAIQNIISSLKTASP